MGPGRGLSRAKKWARAWSRNIRTDETERDSQDSRDRKAKRE